MLHSFTDHLLNSKDKILNNKSQTGTSVFSGNATLKCIHKTVSRFHRLKSLDRTKNIKKRRRAKTVLGSVLQIKQGHAKRLSWRKVLKVFSGELSLTLPPSISQHEYCSSCSVQAKLNNPSEPTGGGGASLPFSPKQGFFPAHCPPHLSQPLVPHYFFICVSLLSLVFTTFFTTFQMNSSHPTYLL